MMKSKIKNTILLSITAVATILAIISVSALDSVSITPLVCLYVCCGWLALFTIANTREENNEN